MEASVWEKQLFESLKDEEGLRLIPYNDSRGFATIGIGHLIDKRNVTKEDLSEWKSFTSKQAEELFYEDVSKIVLELSKRLPLFSKIDGPRKAILANMAFQMGVDGLLDFKNTLKMVENGDYKGAGLGMMTSLWAKQTPNRAKRLSERMIKGTYV